MELLALPAGQQRLPDQVGEIVAVLHVHGQLPHRPAGGNTCTHGSPHLQGQVQVRGPTKLTAEVLGQGMSSVTDRLPGDQDASSTSPLRMFRGVSQPGALQMWTCAGRGLPGASRATVHPCRMLDVPSSTTRGPPSFAG